MAALVDDELKSAAPSLAKLDKLQTRWVNGIQFNRRGEPPAFECPNPTQAANQEPLLINTAGSLEYRPEGQVDLANLFLPSDYVRTYTDLACLEAANEAARGELLLAAADSHRRLHSSGRSRSRNS
jgi:hypothetical protein